jgi:hypothetical protein
VGIGGLRFQRLSQNGEILVDDKVGRLPPLVGFSDGIPLPERWTSNQCSVTDGGVQSDDVLEVGEADSPSQ